MDTACPSAVPAGTATVGACTAAFAYDLDDAEALFVGAEDTDGERGGKSLVFASVSDWALDQNAW